MKIKLKVIILLSLLLLSSILLSACDETTFKELMSMEDIYKQPSFSGVIEEVNDTSLLIRTEDSNISADLVSTSLNSKLKDIYNPEYKIGNKVLVYYDGRIAESYPVQVWSYVVIVEDPNGLQNNFINKFAYKTSAEILKENPNYSPLSLHLALSLATTGADGQTKSELVSLLGLSEDKISENVDKLLKRLHLDNDDSKLFINNSLWLEKEINGQEVVFNENFLKNAEEHFKAEMFSMDFSKARTGKEMTKWISNKTNGLLEPEIITEKGQLASIINTIYFKDKWLSSFEPELTKVDKFTKEDLNQVDLDFMHQSTYSKYYKTNNWTKSSLPFEGGGEMFFVLPDDGVYLESLLNEETLSEIVENDNENTEKVNWSLPRFTVDSEFELIPILKNLGIEEAFSSKANFKNMINDVDVYISNIKQGTKIIVEEGGVEAAAYTQIMLNTTSVIIEEPVDFILNRPFLYGITAKDGTLLFIGTYHGE